MGFEPVQIIGALAAIASTVSFAPQAWRIIRERRTAGLSSATYAITVTAFALWLSYGIIRGDWALIVPNGLCLAMSSFILVMIMVPRPTRERIADAIETTAGIEDG